MVICGQSSRSLILVFLPLILLWPRSGTAQAPTQNSNQARLTLSQVVDKLGEKNVQRATALERYTGRRSYRLDFSGFPMDMHAEMTVDVGFKSPSTEEFVVVSQSGPKVIVKRVLKRLLESEQEALKDENRHNRSEENTSE